MNERTTSEDGRRAMRRDRWRWAGLAALLLALVAHALVDVDLVVPAGLLAVAMMAAALVVDTRAPRRHPGAARRDDGRS